VKEAGKVVKQLLNDGGFYFQNSASQLISIIAAQFASLHVLDCCAAPGSKAITLSILNPKLHITANDIHPGRVKMIDSSISRMKRNNIVTSVSDIVEYKFSQPFDFIIVDAPCTSVGTIRKNPDLKVKIDSEAVQRNAASQEQIMSALLNHTGEPPPYILYSVCSFIKEETEDIMSRILSSPTGSGYEKVDISEILTGLGFHFYPGKMGFYLLPNDDLNNDLFYICLLKNMN
jgi:16S rRNA (cytosine967-C5)-methyltransferase